MYYIDLINGVEGEFFMDELSKVINIGKVLEGQLEQVGIKTLDKLKKVGSKKTWLEIRVIDKSA